MTAPVNFIATTVNFGDTFGLTTAVVEGLLRMIVGFLDFLLTESALPCMCVVFGLLTGHSHVIGLRLAFCAKISLTVCASAPVLC